MEQETVTREQLRQEAMDCLVKALKGGDIPVHVVQAAVSLVLTPEPKL